MTPFEGPTRVYPSKRDTWLTVVLWLSTAGMLWAAGSVWVSAEPLWFRSVMGLVMSLAAALVVWLLYATDYTVTSTSLLIRSGPFRWKVPLHSIREVTPTRNPLSGPALSLDRLQVRYAGYRYGILISPEDKEDFMREIALRVPGLVHDGDRLTSARD